MAIDAEYLSRALMNRSLIPVVGAGFSTATAGLPSWPQLLDRGVTYVAENVPGISTTKLDALRSLQTSDDLLQAFDYLQKLLTADGGEHYEELLYHGFLNEVFHDPAVASEELALALRGLGPRVVMTTNYDSLLEASDVTRGGSWATWSNPSDVRNLLRTGSGVIHLHGRYDLPQSVILSARDYNRIVAADDSASIAQAAFHSGVLLFMGSSIDGLSDPHLGGILEEFSRITDRSRGEESPHVALVRGRPSGAEVARLRRMGIEAVSYGADFDDLPRFLRGLVHSNTITVPARSVRSALQAVHSSQSKGDALVQVAEFIRQCAFPGRNIRISFAEKVEQDGDASLATRYVLPADSTHNVFNYPLSIAAWALVEGRVIAWPNERDVACNFDLIDRLGKLEDVRARVASPHTDEAPELQRYVDLTAVRAGLETGRLTLGEFFQDWSSKQPDFRYTQFISVPVPIIESFGNREQVREYGVYNIDSTDSRPLLEPDTVELLKLASSLTVAVYNRFDSKEAE